MAKPPRSPSGPRPPRPPRRTGAEPPRGGAGRRAPGPDDTAPRPAGDGRTPPAAGDRPPRRLRTAAAADAPRAVKPAKLRFGDKSRAAAQARKEAAADHRAPPARAAAAGDRRAPARGAHVDPRAPARGAHADPRASARADASARHDGPRAPYRSGRDDGRADRHVAPGAPPPGEARPATRRGPDRAPLTRDGTTRPARRAGPRGRLGADERAAPATPRGPRGDNRAHNANRARNASRGGEPNRGGDGQAAPMPAASGDRPPARPATPRRAAAPAPAAAHVDGAPERIAKRLARAGIASRRDVERLIAAGRVALDGVVITTPATILTSLRGITVDGAPVAAPAATRLYVFHKPDGLITAARDPAGRPTIYTALRNALPPDAPRVMPVGRLDYATEGLLLLTNDGELKRTLELPSTGVPRTYRARAYGTVSQTQLEDLIEGIEIDGVRYGKIDANLERRTGANQWVEVTLTEGRNREVRRVLEHLGLEVGRLIRTAYGPFLLGDLPRGAAYEIPADAVERFARTLRPREAKAEPRP